MRREPDRDRIERLRIRLEDVVETYHKAKVDFELAHREYHDAYQELMDWEHGPRGRA